MNYVFTQSASLQAVLQDKILPLTWNDPLFELMPLDYIDASMVIWEQKDNWTGATNPRQYNGGFGRVQREGINQWKVQPGAYGDQKEMLEDYLTEGREIGTFGAGLDIRKAQLEDQDHLLGRAIDRIRIIGWNLLSTGTYSVPGPSGTVLATDTFALQPFTAANPWSDHVNSTPLADMRAMALLKRGHSVRFDATSDFFLNQTWVNHMLSNTNNADIGGRRKIDANNNIEPLSVKQVNEIFLGEDLPKVRPYDEGYYPDPIAGVAQPFQLFIPNNQGVLVGKRQTGEPVMKFWMTRNANNLSVGRGSTQLYTDFEFKKNPVRAISTVAFNGAPAIYFPSAVVMASI